MLQKSLNCRQLDSDPSLQFAVFGSSSQFAMLQKTLEF